MDFVEKIKNLSSQIEPQKDYAITEEATKHALVIPFIKTLGYNPYNLTEVVPEFTADVGTKQGEKVDYAIKKDDKVIMLMECKKCGSDISNSESSQLYRYFSTTEARIAILTDGIFYRFYTDLEETNIMDAKPFFEFNVLDVSQNVIDDIERFSKSVFNLEKVLDSAVDLKYTKLIKQVISDQLDNPCEDFVKFFLSYVYTGRKTNPIILQFNNIVKKALRQFLNDELNQRLKSIMNTPEKADDNIENENGCNPYHNQSTNSDIVTTDEELQAFEIVKEIIKEIVDLERIGYKDTKYYMSILLDNKKVICRFYFKVTKKLLAFPNKEKKYERVEIDNVEDISNYTVLLKQIVSNYCNILPMKEEFDNVN